MKDYGASGNFLQFHTLSKKKKPAFNYKRNPKRYSKFTILYFE